MLDSTFVSSPARSQRPAPRSLDDEIVNAALESLGSIEGVTDLVEHLKPVLKAEGPPDVARLTQLFRGVQDVDTST